MEEILLPAWSFFMDWSGEASAASGGAAAWLTSLTSAFCACAAWRAACTHGKKKKKEKSWVSQCSVFQSIVGSQPTHPPAYSLFLWQTLQSFSWDPAEFPSLSDPLLCTWAARSQTWKKVKESHFFKLTHIYSCRWFFSQKTRCQFSPRQRSSCTQTIPDVPAWRKDPQTLPHLLWVPPPPLGG